MTHTIHSDLAQDRLDGGCGCNHELDPNDAPLGVTRRRVLAGGAVLGAAAVGSQLVNLQASFAAPGAATNGRTLIFLWFPGGQDGLSVVAPVADQNYKNLRQGIAIPPGNAIAIDRGFAMHPAMAPLAPYLKSRQLAFVHGAGTAFRNSHSHFVDQEVAQIGADSATVSGGFLTRIASGLGNASPFQSVAIDSSLPTSLRGSQAVTVPNLDQFALQGAPGHDAQTTAALHGLYTGYRHPLVDQVNNTIGALATAARMRTQKYVPAAGANYPTGGFADGLRTVARLVKEKAGLRIGALEYGGWDMHTNEGTVDNGQMKDRLAEVAGGLAAFARDLGPALKDVTVVSMTEFGRRAQVNGDGGTDHGHGYVMWLLGGGVNGGHVLGRWNGLAPANLDGGDVPVVNDERNVIGEIAQKRLGLGSLATVYPGLAYAAPNVVTTL